MRKRVITLFLALFLLAGCQSVDTPKQTEQTAVYDWMAGESSVPQQRTGLYTQGISSVCNSFECTENGAYFLCDTPTGPYLLYSDHGSDTVIKLCGRADCTHDNAACDSCISGGVSICWFDGHLYSTTDTYAGLELIRMDPDGSNRMTLLDLSELYARSGFHGTVSPTVWNGVFTFGAYKLNENGEEVGSDFYYKLDGSMTEPERITDADFSFLYNAGERFLVWTKARNGGEKGGIAAWEPGSDALTYMTDHPGQPGYFGETEAFYFRDGAVRRLDYGTQQEDVLFKTELAGDYLAAFYPDCIVIACRDQSDRKLYIYNWAYELVDTVELNVQSTIPPEMMICGETPERLILTDNVFFIPRYYIEKSDFGTGKVDLHEYALPDLDVELAMLEEELDPQNAEILNDDNW